MEDIPRTAWYRFLEAVPAVTSYFFLIVPFFAAAWYPKIVAIFVMVYVLLWFLRALKSSAFLMYSFLKSKKIMKADWKRISAFFSAAPPAPKTRFEDTIARRVGVLKEKNAFKKKSDIYHVVIIATYKEEKEILASTFDSLMEADFPLEKVIVVLATEERDRERAEKNALYLKNKYARYFGEFHHIMHPSHLPGEIAGKGANISYAGERIATHLKEKKIDFSNVIVTTLDSDNRLHPIYFSSLTYHYLMEPDRKKRSYQPLIFYYNNIWRIPFINKLIALVNTFWHIAECGEPYHLRNFSSHAQSLDALVEMNFWSRQTITEDGHQFWRSYFHFKGDYDVIPIFIPIYQDAVQNETYFTSLIGQYRQLRRWAWGASDIPYVIMKTKKMFRDLPFLKTFDAVLYLISGHLMWATGPIIIMLNQSLPTLFNPRFADSLFVYNLQYLLTILFTLVFICIPICMWISFLSLPRPPGRWGALKRVELIVEWFLLPFIIITYGAIPALDAQTRLMLGKRLEFQVTEKVRK